MIEKSLSLKEFNLIYAYYIKTKPKNIYLLKKKVNNIMINKMCKSTHKTKYDKIIKILKNRNLFSKNKKNKYSNTSKMKYNNLKNFHNNTRNSSPISYLLR